MRRLVEALNACWVPHEAAPAAPITLADFKRDIRERHVWCSSCMIAFEGTAPIGVLIGAKRPAETLVDRIAVRPDRLRLGHGRHMLDSLGAKLGILGPPRLVAEVPDDRAPAAALFAACGFTPGGTLTDWVLDDGGALAAAAGAADSAGTQARGAGAATAGGTEFAVPVSVADLAANRLLEDPPGVAWDRAAATLAARADILRGLALASLDRIAAFALWRPAPDGASGASIDALGPAAAESGGPETTPSEPLRRLLALVLERTGPPLCLPGLAETEVPAAWLRQWGFRAAARRRRFTATARAG